MHGGILAQHSSSQERVLAARVCVAILICGWSLCRSEIDPTDALYAQPACNPVYMAFARWRTDDQLLVAKY